MIFGCETCFVWFEQFSNPIEQRETNISAGELIGVVESIGHGISNGLFTTEGHKVVFRCDEEVACDTVNRCRSRSRKIISLLRILKGTCDDSGIRVWLQHIPGLSNVSADRICRNVDKAHATSSTRWEDPPKKWQRNMQKS